MNNPVFFLMRNLRYSLACLTALFLLSFSGPGTALAGEKPAEPGQNKGFTMRTIGAMEFFSFQDRPATMPASLFTSLNDPALVKKYMPRNSAPASVSVFAVKQGNSVVLIDAGYGAAGPGESALAANMAKAGITPDMVSLVLLTHMHMDHIAGLLDKDGGRAFPKAKVLVSAPEAAYWLRPDLKGEKTANFELAANVEAAYGADFLPPFAFNSVVAPGVTALDASGHTPGHTAFLVESEGQGLLVIGDLVHAAALQFPEPSASSSYDMDPVKAAAARAAYLSMAAEKKLPVAGMHLPYPPVGMVSTSDATKGFVFLQGER